MFARRGLVLLLFLLLQLLLLLFSSGRSLELPPLSLGSLGSGRSSSICSFLLCLLLSLQLSQDAGLLSLSLSLSRQLALSMGAARVATPPVPKLLLVGFLIGLLIDDMVLIVESAMGLLHLLWIDLGRKSLALFALELLLIGLLALVRVRIRVGIRVVIILVKLLLDAGGHLLEIVLLGLKIGIVTLDAEMLKGGICRNTDRHTIVIIVIFLGLRAVGLVGELVPETAVGFLAGGNSFVDGLDLPLVILGRNFIYETT